jgi:mono/diheme cytochrome c family protein
LLFFLFFATGCSTQSPVSSQLKTAENSVIDQRLASQDFAFPSKHPSLMRGRTIFNQHCVRCHAPAFWQQQTVKEHIAYTTPIDTYLMLTTGESPKVVMPTSQRQQVLPGTHPAFKDKLSRDERWAVIFYTRYLAGAGDLKSSGVDMAGVFGGNCAVCHGSKGQGDGFLHTGKTGNHELHDAVQVKNLQPAPANFQQYNRVYNRTDAQLFKYLCEGIYPSAMPAWYGNVNLDKDTGKPTYVFDEQLLMNLVRYVRTWSYENDLPETLPEVKSPPEGLRSLQSCQSLPTNHPWYSKMTQFHPNPSSVKPLPLSNPITGGMVLHSSKPTGGH